MSAAGAILAVLVALAVAAPALAAPADAPALTRAAMNERASRLAYRVWPQLAGTCPLGLRVLWSVPPAAEHFAAWSWEGDCEVYVNVTDPQPWPLFCTRVLHEAGHVWGWRDPVTGEPHASDPHHLMAVRDILAFREVRRRVRGRWRWVKLWPFADPACRRRAAPGVASRPTA